MKFLILKKRKIIKILTIENEGGSRVKKLEK
jgi:hypothetical protein